MAIKESIQHKLGRVRPPRVQITYDVEVGDAVEQKELPLVVGILADLAGQREGLPRLKERKFTEIDRDNFDQVMKTFAPQLQLKVADKLTGGDNRMSVELKFESIDSFHPNQLIKQIAPLSELLERRQRLVDLMAKLDGNDALMERLQSLLTKKEELQRLQSELRPEQQQ
jgi:type VI secretion system ImpB/VipA family protein